MSIAEELIEKGRQEGLDQGALIGRIQAMEDLLGLPVTAVSDLGQRSRSQARVSPGNAQGPAPGTVLMNRNRSSALFSAFLN